MIGFHYVAVTVGPISKVFEFLLQLVIIKIHHFISLLLLVFGKRFDVHLSHSLEFFAFWLLNEIFEIGKLGVWLNFSVIIRVDEGVKTQLIETGFRRLSYFIQKLGQVFLNQFFSCYQFRIFALTNITQLLLNFRLQLQKLSIIGIKIRQQIILLIHQTLNRVIIVLKGCNNLFKERLTVPDHLFFLVVIDWSTRSRWSFNLLTNLAWIPTYPDNVLCFFFEQWVYRLCYCIIKFFVIEPEANFETQGHPYSWLDNVFNKTII